MKESKTDVKLNTCTQNDCRLQSINLPISICDKLLRCRLENTLAALEYEIAVKEKIQNTTIQTPFLYLKSFREGAILD